MLKWCIIEPRFEIVFFYLISMAFLFYKKLWPCWSSLPSSDRSCGPAGRSTACLRPTHLTHDFMDLHYGLIFNFGWKYSDFVGIQTVLWFSFSVHYSQLRVTCARTRYFILFNQYYVRTEFYFSVFGIKNNHHYDWVYNSKVEDVSQLLITR